MDPPPPNENVSIWINFNPFFFLCFSILNGQVLPNSLFTLHRTGTGTGTGNRTSTIEDNGSGSYPCLSAVWTVQHNVESHCSHSQFGPGSVQCECAISPDWTKIITPSTCWVAGKLKLVSVDCISRDHLNKIFDENNCRQLSVELKWAWANLASVETAGGEFLSCAMVFTKRKKI